MSDLAKRTETPAASGQPMRIEHHGVNVDVDLYPGSSPQPTPVVPSTQGAARAGQGGAGADNAVICVSNKSVTDRVVGEFERRGVLAFGPICDS